MRVSDTIIVAIITVIGGGIVTYIVWLLKKKHESPKGKNRIDTAFDELENVIKIQKTLIEYRDKVIARLEEKIRQYEKDKQILNARIVALETENNILKRKSN